MRQRFAALSLLLALVVVTPGFARVISYSPYTDQAAIPAHQHRMNRHFVLVEGVGTLPPPILAPPQSFGSSVVLYDFLGEKEPKVIFPQEGSAVLQGVAVRENAAGVPSILVFGGGQSGPRFHLSTDGGATWKTLDIPITTWIQQMPTGIDVGGPFAAARGSQLRIGNEQWPFVVSTRAAIYAIASDGSTRKFLEQPSNTGVNLVGRDAVGNRFLARAAENLYVIDVDSGTALAAGTTTANVLDGWITPSGGVYIDEMASGTLTTIYISHGVRTPILQAPATGLNLFAVPTHDHSGAWIIERGPGKPTVLYRHSAANGLVKQWEDITAPQVEALHTGSSGTKLLVQVHRPRPQADQRIFQDPALAVWKVGEPAPRLYDELYMDEQWNKGFVHLDVEKIEEGEPFVFDSGVRFLNAGGPIISPSPPSSGGGDVVQEWGVVRASLKQRLVLPAVGRGPGAFNSNWVTDVIIYNPMDEEQSIDIRFVLSGAPSTAAQNQIRTLELAPREILLIEDVLLSVFMTEAATGAFFIEPEHGVSMTSRTYSKSEEGTYGYSMNAMDVYAAAASARFPLTFAGAFLGPNYRTNIVITDAGESGPVVNLRAAGASGLMGLADVLYDVPARGQQQFNFISSTLGLYPWETGGLVFRPRRGSAIGSVFTTDNRTNDATYFPPDLPAPIVRTIPAIGHVNGANNSRFRTDLYLYNPTAKLSTVTLQIRMWDSPDTATLNFTLLPAEARIIPDALQTLFQRTGIARLRYQSQFGNANGVRVTSRTYSVREDGGTYG
ncbi:MAG TPA: hypothetical protein VM779_03665, partial [Thermoanaerobaculia bacterium]|nr:hypothetical protein [Thermoanaerobaculia bacterium]